MVNPSDAGHPLVEEKSEVKLAGWKDGRQGERARARSGYLRRACLALCRQTKVWHGERGHALAPSVSAVSRERPTIVDSGAEGTETEVQQLACLRKKDR